MKTKPRVYSVALLLLALAMVSSVMISGTFAKYTTAYAGQDTALVARWSFDAKGGQAGTTALGDPGTPAELDLFDHELNTFMNNNNGLTDADKKFILAPGVHGQFVVKINYVADVAADIAIETAPLSGNAAVPVEYSLDGTHWVALDDLADALATKIISDVPDSKATVSDPDTDGTFRLAAVANSSVTPYDISETVQWRWAFDTAAQSGDDTTAIASNDTTDTGLGAASQSAAASDITKRTTYGIKITLTATQVTPTTT